MTTRAERDRVVREIKVDQILRQQRAADARYWQGLAIKVDVAKRDARKRAEYLRDPVAYIEKRARERVAVRRVREAQARIDEATAAIRARRAQAAPSRVVRMGPASSSQRVETRAYDGQGGRLL